MSKISDIIQQYVTLVKDNIKIIKNDGCKVHKILELTDLIIPTIRHFEAILNSDISIGEKNRIENNIGHLMVFRDELKELVGHNGGSVNINNVDDDFKWQVIESAFKSRIVTGLIKNNKFKDPKLFLDSVSSLIILQIENQLKKHNNIKANIVFSGEFQKISGDNDEITDIKYITTANKTFGLTTNLSKRLIDFKNIILNELSEFQDKESGWTLIKILSVKVNINKYEPFSGSSYIELPKTIQHKKACINIKNNDSACFAWSLVSALYPASPEKKSNRVTSYPHYNDVLNFTGIEFPVKLKDVKKIEKLNNLTINVYIY